MVPGQTAQKLLLFPTASWTKSKLLCARPHAGCKDTSPSSEWGQGGTNLPFQPYVFLLSPLTLHPSKWKYPEVPDPVLWAPVHASDFKASLCISTVSIHELSPSWISKLFEGYDLDICIFWKVNSKTLQWCVLNEWVSAHMHVCKYIYTHVCVYPCCICVCIHMNASLCCNREIRLWSAVF